MHLKSLSFVKSRLVLSIVFATIIVSSISSVIGITLAKLDDNNNSIASNSNGTVKQITVKWLPSNETKPNDSSTIRVSNQDFWKIFEPLLQTSINE